MNLKKSIMNNIYLKSTVIIIMIFGFGYFIGNGCGSLMLRNILLGNGSSKFLLYSPSNEFYTIYIHLNSEDELHRLNGYYALADNNLIDEEFIIERYEMENSPLLKRTIVWVMGKLKNNTNIENFLIKKYSVSSTSVKMEILRSLRNMNYKRFEEFVKDIKVDKKIIDML